MADVYPYIQLLNVLCTVRARVCTTLYNFHVSHLAAFPSSARDQEKDGISRRWQVAKRPPRSSAAVGEIHAVNRQAGSEHPRHGLDVEGLETHTSNLGPRGQLPDRGAADEAVSHARRHPTGRGPHVRFAGRRGPTPRATGPQQHTPSLAPTHPSFPRQVCDALWGWLRGGGSWLSRVGCHDCHGC